MTYFAETQSDILWAIRQRLSGLALALLDAAQGAEGSTSTTCSDILLVRQPNPLFIYLCTKIWPDGSTYSISLFYSSAEEGQVENMKSCKEWLAKSSYDIEYKCGRAMRVAAERGHLAVMEQCRKWSAFYHYWAIGGAAYGGHLELLKRCKSWIISDGITPDYNGAMEEAAAGGHIEVVRKCKKWGATNYRMSFVRGVAGNHIDVVKQCKVWMDDTVSVGFYAWPIQMTTLFKYAKLERLLKKWRTACQNRH